MPLSWDEARARQRHARAIAATYAPQLAAMHARHGAANPGQRCGDCAHLARKSAGIRTYFKCRQFANTNGAGSDWRLYWPACGAFQLLRPGATP